MNDHICKLCGDPITDPSIAWREQTGWVTPRGAKGMTGATQTGGLAHAGCVILVRATRRGRGMSEMRVAFSDGRPLGVDETSLQLPANLSEDDWREVGATLGRISRASAWWVGDWINYGEDAGYVSRGKYEIAERLTGLKRQTLYAYASVARHTPILDRNQGLSLAQHRRSLGEGNGNAHDEANEVIPATLVLTTERQRLVAARAKERVERAVGSCNALGRAAADLKIAYAVAAASDEEVKGWDESFTDAIRALRKIRARIREAGVHATP